MSDIKKIFEEVLARVKPSEKEANEINETSGKLIADIKREIKRRGIKAEVFVGGSAAKGTLVKKKNYDVDIFVRFAENVDSSILEDILKKISSVVEKIHGSRDYFMLKDKNKMYEIVPIKMIAAPAEAENSADLSYFHV